LEGLLWDTSAMKQLDAVRLDELAQAYSTQADYCHHMAEGPGGTFDEPWALLAAAWTKLAKETKARSRIAAELTIFDGRLMHP
jgi:hypothetical protein